eukprot:scaffold521_cov108-Cylindrotheca_fusiformis.AAC.1
MSGIAEETQRATTGVLSHPIVVWTYSCYAEMGCLVHSIDDDLRNGWSIHCLGQQTMNCFGQTMKTTMVWFEERAFLACW